MIAPNETPTTAQTASDAETEAIAAMIDVVVRPLVERDGGAIRFCSFSDGIVYVELSGACSSCPAIEFTLTMGVERTLRKAFRSVKAVRQWSGDGNTQGNSLPK